MSKMQWYATKRNRQDQVNELDIIKLARWMVILGIVTLLPLPFLPTFIWSIAGRWHYPAILPTELSLRSWKYVFSASSMVPKGIQNSFVIALAVTLLSIPLGVLGGRALGLHNFKGKKLINLLVLSPAIVPVLATSMGIHVLFIKYGLANTIPGVVLAHLIPTLPYMVSIMTGIFANYDHEYEEQARTLGAKWFQTFLHITIPFIMPALIVGSLYTFILSWNQYVLTLLIGGGKVITLPMLVFTFISGGDRATAAAVSLTLVIPSLLFLIVSSKYITGRDATIASPGRV